MGKYAGAWDDAAASDGTTSATVYAAGVVRRGKVFEILYGSHDTPADAPFKVEVARITALGTGTVLGAGNPAPLDPADAACTGLVAENHSVNPTMTLSLLEFAMNQRTTFRWSAAPGRELVYPATASNGFALYVVEGPGVLAAGHIHFEE